MSYISANVKRILAELPPGVELVAAVKTRTPEEILEAVDAGVTILGENYVQEGEKNRQAIGNRTRRHFIGHLQKNKVKKAVEIFDMIETIDSSDLAMMIDTRCLESGIIMPVLIEVNSGREVNKSGILPEETENLVREISQMVNIRIAGLMTMGPIAGNPEDSRPYFCETRKIFEHIKELNLPEVEMRYLSMGMTNSYRIAIEEGANIVRLGTVIFGERK